MSQEPSQQLQHALREAFAADHPATTIVLARRVLADNPNDAATWTRLGHALSEIANHDEAENALKTALLFGGDVRREIVYGTRGHLFKFRGDYETAANWYRKAIDSNPDNASGYIFLGAALARQGKLAEAEAAHRNCYDMSARLH